MSTNYNLSLPIEIKGVTPGWLTTALSDYAPGVRVRGFETVDAIRTTCTKLRLQLDLEGNREDSPIAETVILKGGFEPHSRRLHNMHLKEVRAYGEVLPVVGLRAPTCYFAGYDASQRQGIVIMEDLRARGVSFCSALRPQGFDEIARRLGELARFHAMMWNGPDIQPGGRFDWVEEQGLLENNYFDQYLTPEVWESYVRAPRGAAASTEFHGRGWLIDSIERVAAYARTLPRCIIHGDTHLGNLYVDTDGTPGFFDPGMSLAPAMLEVAYFLVCALDLSDRRRLEGALIQRYLAELRSHGVTPPSFDEALHQYAIFLANAYSIFIINEAAFQAEAVNTAYTARMSQAMLDHDTKGKLARLKLP